MSTTRKIPQPGSCWKHYNGSTYKVITVTNQHSTRPEYRITIVYVGENGRVWSRPYTDWHRSMTELPEGTKMDDKKTYISYCRDRGDDPLNLATAEDTFSRLQGKVEQMRDQVAQWQRAVLQQGEVIAELKEQKRVQLSALHAALDQKEKRALDLERRAQSLSVRLANALRMITLQDRDGFCSNGNYPSTVAREALMREGLWAEPEVKS